MYPDHSSGVERNVGHQLSKWYISVNELKSACMHAFFLNLDQITENAGQLLSKDARKKWEQHFDRSFIDPVCSQLEASVNKALDLISNDDQQGVVVVLFTETIYTILDCRTRPVVLSGIRKSHS